MPSEASNTAEVPGVLATLRLYDEGMMAGTKAI